MISFKVVMKISDSNKTDLLDIARGLLEPVRVQECCISSHLVEDIEEAGRLWLLQEWTDEAALANHIQGVRFRSLLATLDLLEGQWQMTVNRLSTRHETDNPEELLCRLSCDDRQEN